MTLVRFSGEFRMETIDLLPEIRGEINITRKMF